MATGVVWRVCYANTETRPFITTHETFSVQMRRGRRNGRAAAESEKLSARSGRSRHSFRSHDAAPSPTTTSGGASVAVAPNTQHGPATIAAGRGQQLHVLLPPTVLSTLGFWLLRQ